MAYSFNSYYPQAQHIPALGNGVQTIANSDGTTIKALFVAGTNGSRIEFISAISTDTAIQYLNFYRTISSVNYGIGNLAIPLASGTQATATVTAVDVLRSLNLPYLNQDSNGNRYLTLAPGETLSIGTTGTVTSGKTITLTCQAEDY